MSNHDSDNDSDDAGFTATDMVGNSKIEFQYYKKGAIGKKKLHLFVELESQTIIFSDGNQLPARSIVNTSKIANTPGGLLLSIRLDAKLHEKKWFFKSGDEASLFQLYIATINNAGSTLFAVFQAIDSKNNHQITWKDLRRCALRYAIHLSQAEAEAMVVIADENNNKYIDYREFFQFFMLSNITGVESCILEWRNKLADDLKRSEPRASRATLDIIGTESRNFLGNDSPPQLVPGEIVLNVIQHVRYSLSPPQARNPRPPFVGNIYFTTYRLIFSSYLKAKATAFSRHEVPPSFDELSLPLCTILRIEVLKGEMYSLALVCKDLRVFRICFEAADSFTSTFVSVIAAQAFPPSIQQCFAFNYKEAFHVDAHQGWGLYSLRREFTRQGVLQSDLWRIWNDNYALADTYPREFILPSMLSMSDITEAAKFRSKARLPALTWRNPRTGAVLCRSSQPMVGVLGHKCLADKYLLNLYRVRGDMNDRSEIESPSDFYIYDCRKPIAATANSALGKGVEDERNYEHTKVIFLDIDNIHTMRASMRLLDEALFASGYITDAESITDAKIEDSEWLSHVRKILCAGVSVAERVELERAGVLVHCSDGWDRTAQVCATAELLLDPYYRTIEGFCVLIEKDWCAFGHKFQDRIGHCESNAESQERSPVFLQWLDVVHQIMLQFPNQLEFTVRLLIFLADAVYSCQFGTFLGNSDKERKVDLQCETRTKSVWSYVLCHAKEFMNPSYEMCDQALWPSCSFRRLKLWERYFFRWEPDMHPRVASGFKWTDDWGTLLLSPAPQPPSLTPLQKVGKCAVDHDAAADSNISRPLSCQRTGSHVELRENVSGDVLCSDMSSQSHSTSTNNSNSQCLNMDDIVLSRSPPSAASMQRDGKPSAADPSILRSSRFHAL
eukprot:CAMPEP_0185036120 /NCGR_PEP_ID=MMETSP1103-20130426/28615_1 /TAXON_ID=36769 /ORGANISM="Paraphysomonas bandaiensis, Strain Caron Lab Isolate" /LENGTH=899 /DNA_ID=CAMNT_0027573521 /DNA_START=60 /DNA_END=2759 /DNA_ORIENTATION=-